MLSCCMDMPYESSIGFDGKVKPVTGSATYLGDSLKFTVQNSKNPTIENLTAEVLEGDCDGVSLASSKVLSGLTTQAQGINCTYKELGERYSLKIRFVYTDMKTGERHVSTGTIEGSAD